MVKDAQSPGPATVYYAEVDDYLSAGEKIRAISTAQQFTGLAMREIVPNQHGDWTNQRTDEFSQWPVMGSKEPAPGLSRVFEIYSRGLESGRDAWVYNYSLSTVTNACRSAVEFFNQTADSYSDWAELHRLSLGKESATKFTKTHSSAVNDPRCFSWTLSARSRLAGGKKMSFDPERLTEGIYRPFSKQHVYYDRALNHIWGSLGSIFPTPHHENTGILLTAPASHFDFTPLMTNLLPNLHLLDTGQFFPRWTYEKTESEEGTLDLETGARDIDEYGYRRVDNITDGILKLYREAVGDQVTKDDICFYVYGLLHDPVYRETYAADLKKMLPHIPTPETRERFEQLVSAGRALSDLHVGYEDVEPYLVDVQLKPGTDPGDRETWRVSKDEVGEEAAPGHR